MSASGLKTTQPFESAFAALGAEAAGDSPPAKSASGEPASSVAETRASASTDADRNEAASPDQAAADDAAFNEEAPIEELRREQDDEDHWEPHVERNPWLVDDEEEEHDFKIDKAGMDDEGLDMTPMVDVTFLLLIFFMITASFAVQKSMQTTPPEPDEEGVSQNVNDDVEEDSVVVEIDAENNIRVEDVEVAGIGELIDMLTNKRTGEGKTDMMIEVHELAKHGTVVLVTDAGLEADMQRIRRTTIRGDD